MTSLFLAIALWGFSVLAPLGGEPVVASVKSAPATAVYQTYQVIVKEVITPKYHPPVTVEVGVLTNYGDCTAPCRAKRILGEDAWGYWQWHCLGRHGGWQICGVQ